MGIVFVRPRVLRRRTLPKPVQPMHGEETRIARVDGRAKMVAISRRKRMVAHNIADVLLLFAVMVRRRTFFQEDPSIVFLTFICIFISLTPRKEVFPRNVRELQVFFCFFGSKNTV